MRLMNTASHITYVHPSEREPDRIPNPDDAGKPLAERGTIENPKAGQPKPGATIWHLRALTSREDGALQDAIYDMSRTRARQGDGGDVQVDMNMVISPSQLRRNRTRIGLVGWENLLDAEGNPIPFVAEDLVLGARTFKAAPDSVLDMMSQRLIADLAAQVERLSSITPTEGND